MKFLIFSDLHHVPGTFIRGTFEDLASLQQRAEKEQCDFIIHAGDFCHGPAHVMDYVKAYNDFHIPSYHCLGNHDTDNTPLPETLRCYNMPDDHYFFDCGGYRIIVMSTNYFPEGDGFTAYSGPNYHHISIYERDYVSPEQIKWLEETIASSEYPCIIISHASFERRVLRVPNADAVLHVINEANKRRPHSVLMCINGHYHVDYLRILDGVCYLDMNSSCYHWLPNPHDLYPEEIVSQYPIMNHVISYNEPLSAVITLEGTTIDIRGTEGTPLLGITREMTGNTPVDYDSRLVNCRVQTAKITLG